MLLTIPTGHRLRVVFAFTLVYLFWGSTYLGIRVAVEPVDRYLAAGAAIILPAVALVTLSEAPAKNGTPVAGSG